MSLPIDMLHDFGGDGPVLHLAHANGIPPATYRVIARHLTDHYHVIGLPARPLWPDSRPEQMPSWHPMACDLTAGLDGLGLRGIVGVGHSMGGVATMWASIARPDLFHAVVLIDPVILPPAVLRTLRVMRGLGLRTRQPLVQGALRRRRTWPSRQDCYAHYQGRGIFAAWPDDSLRAYVDAGTRTRSDGSVELIYPPEWEAHIFATAPADVWQDVPYLKPPTLVVYGERSDTFRATSQRHMARRAPHTRFAVIPTAGHMVPLERPAQTAEEILRFLHRDAG
ncbi:MAG: alpha/beta hydrolase [Anaerolineae bacterium]|nr:alpha/beta hydrolase [Anaerolineae bacterium]